MTEVSLVGAGLIARTHAEVLAGLSNLRVTSVVDPDLSAAGRLARRAGTDRIFVTVQEMLQQGGAARAHVMVPPHLHASVTVPLLEAGVSVLLEKPLAVNGSECASLAQASSGGARLGVNQNFVHHPAFARLRHLVQTRALGRPQLASCLYSMPLRQLQARAFGHWMFREPGNILLEQAVHPLSQIAVLCGTVQEIRAIAAPATEIAAGVPFCASAEVSLRGANFPAQFHFAVGQSYPVWQITVLCDDGVIVADMVANRTWCQARGRWLEAVDTMLSGLRSSAALARESIVNFGTYAAAQAGIARRSDAFFLSMKGSIGAFHAALDSGVTLELDGRFGAMLVGLCEAIRDQAFPAPALRPAAAPVVAEPDAPAEIAILGGTGFIGRHVVRRFLDTGMRVSVMARSLDNLPADYSNPLVTLVRGSISDAEAVGRAIEGAKVVVNLAHGGGGSTREETRAAMVGGAETVARACLARGVRRLVHVGSIAGLYLGPQVGIVVGSTPPDPLAEKRADYARAKALCDQTLLRMHAHENLPVVILRPGVVVGEGGPPFHSGVALFNNDQHWVGWNHGRNPLPFVLVEDVAEAVVLATSAEAVEGHCYNLVGDVAMNAREYTALVGEKLQRPMRYHPQSVTWLWLEDVGKWLVKRAAGRKPMFPSRRDFLSRGMAARFDCSDAQRDLGWKPVTSREHFIARAIAVHAP